MPPITNLTELWQDDEKNDALLLCAKPTAGSDYAIFAALCDAFALMPGHPARARAEAQLKTLFGCDLPPVPENRDRIWQQTAEALLARKFSRAEAERIAQPEAFIAPAAFILQPEPASDYPDLPDFPETDLAAWESRMTRWLASIDGKGVSLSLPESCQPKKPNRYAVEKHLSGAAPDPDLWITQILRFLLHALQKSTKSILLKTACDPAAVAELLAMFPAKIPILWMPRNVRQAAQTVALVRACPGIDLSLAIREGDGDPQDLARVAPLGRVHLLKTDDR